MLKDKQTTRMVLFVCSLEVAFLIQPPNLFKNADMLK